MTRKTWVNVLVSMFVVGEVSSLNSCSIPLEAEHGFGGKQMHRSEASGGIAVQLLKGEAINYHLNFNCTIQLLNVRYSNDGIGDTIEVTINGRLLGSFKSFAETGKGDNWNIFRKETNFTIHLLLFESEAEIKVTAVEADEYGVEIDKLSLQVTCSRVDPECPQLTMTNNDVDTSSDDNTSQLSTGELIAIISVIVGAVIGIPGCIVAIYQINKCCND